MKHQNVVLVLLLIAFLLITAGTGLGWFVLQDQVHQLDSLKNEQAYMRRRLAMFKDNLEEFDAQVKNATAGFKTIAMNLKNIEQEVVMNKTKSKEIASKLSSLDIQFDNWEVLYNAMVSRIGTIRQDFLSYTEKMYKEQAQMQGDLESVELGEISVEKGSAVGGSEN